MRPTMYTPIMILISEPIVRSVIQETLEHEGYSVMAAGDLGTAIDRLKELTPELLMIGPYVESIAGYDAAMFLRTKCPGLRVLMVGGLIDDDRLQYRMTLEGFDIFPKPFSAASLLEKVKEVLQHTP
ncbi:MAG TPA: response regulator [Candidatus Acidoferrum sp.]|nr:response regulator [Candidatus Acidoferrum sp.]